MAINMDTASKISPFSLSAIQLLVSVILILSLIAGYASASCQTESCVNNNQGTVDDYDVEWLGDEGGISMYSLDGNYDRGNSIARRALLQKYYEDHADTADFVIVLTNFEFETGDALAFYNSVQNDVEGVGSELYDYSSHFGSEGNLEGIIDLADQDRYTLNPMAPNYDTLLTVLAHEVLHRWGARVSFKDSSGSISTDLIGRDGSHWSFLMDTSASVEYGHKWEETEPGLFTAVGAKRFYSPLDLYLMGLLPAEDVPDFFYIDSPDADPNDLPALGTQVTGTKVPVSVDQIIEAEGERIPSYENAQKRFDFSFILLTRPDDAIDSETFTGALLLKQNFSERFALLTRGKGIANILANQSSDTATGEKGTIDDGDLSGEAVQLEKALDWVQSQYNAETGWEDTDYTNVRDTVSGIRVLQEFQPDSLDAEVFELLSNKAITSIDTAYALFEYADEDQLASINDLLAESLSESGGWGLTSEFDSSILDTALAVDLINKGSFDVPDEAAINYLLANQNPDGGWPIIPGGKSDTITTLAVLKALRTSSATEAVNQGRQYIIDRQSDTGGFGDVYETASVVNHLAESGQLSDINLEAANNFLSSRQNVSGSWEGSVYKTGIVVAALEQKSYPNLAIDQIKVDKDRYFEGEVIHVVYSVANDGYYVAPVTTARLSISGEFEDQSIDISVPELLPGQKYESTYSFDSKNKTGDAAITLSLDIDQTVNEVREQDNQETETANIVGAVEGVDLYIPSNSLSYFPEQPSVLPTTQGFNVEVRNLGTSDSSDFTVQLLEKVDSSSEVLIDEKTISIQGRSSDFVNLSHLRQKNGRIDYVIRADASDDIQEASEHNNEHSVAVDTTDTVDLVAEQESISLNSGQLETGKVQTLSLSVRNQGTVRADDVRVQLEIASGDEVNKLLDISDDIPANGVFDVDVDWMPQSVGEYTATLDVDSDNTVTEVDETNNSIERLLSVELVEGINLVSNYNDIILTPESGIETEGAVVKTLVRNSGSENATSVRVELYDGSPDNGGTLVDSKTIPEVSSNSSETVELIWKTIDGVGTHYPYVVLDPDNTIAEINEDDNTSFTEYEVESQLDLALPAGALTTNPAYPASEQPLELTVYIQNYGGESSGPFSVDFYLGHPQKGGRLISREEAPGVSPYGSQTVSLSTTATSEFDNQTVYVEVNPDQSVTESDYQNNYLSRQISLQSTDVYVSEPFISPDGDGVKDDTTVFASVPTTSNSYTVQVQNMDSGEIVRNESVEALGSSISWRWDGKDDNDVVVDDGEYGVSLSELSKLQKPTVVVDNNRLGILEATANNNIYYKELFEDVYDITYSKAPGGSIYILNLDSSQQYNDFELGISKVDPATGEVTFIDPFWSGNYYLASVTDAETSLLISYGNIESGLFEIFDLKDGAIRTASLSSLVDEVIPDGAKVRQVIPLDNSYLIKLQEGYNGRLHFAQIDEKSGESNYLGSLDDSPSNQCDYLYATEKTESTVLLECSSTDDGWDSYYGSIQINLENDSLEYHPYLQANSSEGVTAKARLNEADGSIDIDFSSINGDGGGISIPLPVNARSYISNLQWSPDGRSLIIEKYNERCNFMGFLEAFRIQYPSMEWKRLFIGDRGFLPGSGCASIVFNDGSKEIAEYHFDRQYTSRSVRVSVKNTDGTIKLKAKHRGTDEAQLDYIALIDSAGRTHHPSDINLDGVVKDASVISEIDSDVHDVSKAEFELIWNNVPSSSDYRLVVHAREADVDIDRFKPVQFPTGENGYYTISTDTKDETAVFSSIVSPGSGHPSAPVSTSYSFSENGLDLWLDFGIDNSDNDHTDWAKVKLRAGSRGPWKEYHLDASGGQWGHIDFSDSELVRFRHKQYSFHIPNEALPHSQSGTLQLRVQAYGSAGLEVIPEGGENIEIFRVEDTVPEGDVIPDEMNVPVVLASRYQSPTTVWLPGDGGLLTSHRFRDKDSIYDGLYSPIVISGTPNDPAYQLLFKNASIHSNSLGFSRNGDYISFRGRIDQEAHNQSMWSVLSLANLTVDLRLRIEGNNKSVHVEGTATDRYFESYELQYKEADSDDWISFKRSSTPVVDGQLATWVPPKPGTYQVRLIGRDKSGHDVAAIENLSWATSTKITNFTSNYDYISPNGDGVQDEYKLSFRVLSPVNLDVKVETTQGEVIHQWSDFSDQIGGEKTIAWDGRNSLGYTVPDGQYKVSVNDVSFWLTVDTDFPKVSGSDLDLVRIAEAPDGGYIQDGPTFYKDLRHNQHFFVKEERLATVAIQEKDFGSQSWSHLKSYPPENSDEIPYSYSEDSVNKQYRVIASDLAGNSAVQPLGSNRQSKVVIYGAGLLEDEPKFYKPTIRLFDVIPTGRDGTEFPYGIEIGDHQLAFFESVRSPLESIRLRYQYLDENDEWSTKRVLDIDQVMQCDGSDLFSEFETGEVGLPELFPGYTGYGLPDCIEQPGLNSDTGYYNIKLPISELPTSSEYRVEVEVSDGGNTVISNSVHLTLFQPSVQLYLDTYLNDDGEPVSEKRSQSAGSAVVSHTDIPWPAELFVVIQSDTDSDYYIERMVPSAKEAVSDNTKKWVEYSLPPLKRCHDYTLQAYLKDTSGELIDLDSKVKKVPCVEIRVNTTGESIPRYPEPVYPVRSNVCGLQPEGKYRIPFKIKENGNQVVTFELVRYRNDGTEVPVYSEADPGSDLVVDFDASEIEHAERVRFSARARSSNGEVVSESFNLVVDHELPDIDMFYPKQGDKLCPTGWDDEGHALLDVMALAVDDFSGGVAPPPASLSFDFYIHEEVVGQSDRQYLPATVPSEKLVFNGTVGQLELLKSSQVNLAIEAKDWSGGRVCQSREFHFDGLVEYQLQNDGDLISPNGDGVKDTLKMTLTAAETIVSTLDLYRAVEDDQSDNGYVKGQYLGSIVENKTMPPGEHDIHWAGMDGNNVPVSDGTYLLEASLSDGCGNRNIGDEITVVEVDTTPPVAMFVSPQEGDELPLVSDILLTVKDQNIKSYAVELSADSENNWSLIHESDLRKSIDSKRVQSLNTYGIQGAFVLKLSASDAAGNIQVSEINTSTDNLADLLTDYRPSPEIVSVEGASAQPVSIYFQLARSANIDLAVIDDSTDTERDILIDGFYESGNKVKEWNGQLDGTAIPDGSYSIRITATDAEVPAIQQIESLSIEVDSTPPDIHLAGIKNGFLQVDQGKLSLAVEDVTLDTFDYRVTHIETGRVMFDEDQLASGATSIDRVLAFTTDMPEGEYILTAFATDQANNVRSLETHFIWDTEAPKVTIGSPDEQTLYAAGLTDIAVEGEVFDKHLDEYRVDIIGATGSVQDSIEHDEVNANPLADFVDLDLDDGNYTLKVTAKDLSGRVGADEISLEVDGIPPAIDLALEDGDYLTESTDLAGSIFDKNLQQYEVRYSYTDNHDIEHAIPLVVSNSNKEGSLYHWDTLPEDSRYRLFVRAVDEVGQTTLETRELVVDTRAPGKPEFVDHEIQKQGISLEWQGDEPSDFVGYRLYRNGSVVADELVSTDLMDSTTDEGRYVFQISAIDVAGNESERDELTVVVDRTGPDVSIGSPEDGTLLQGVTDLRGTAYSEDDFQQYHVSVEQNGAEVPIATYTLPRQGERLAQWNTLDHADGDYTLTVRAEDVHGNLNSETVSVSVDNTPPGAPEGLTYNVNGSDVSVQWEPSVSEDVKGYLVYRNGRLYNADGPVIGSIEGYVIEATMLGETLNDGDYDYTVYAMDRVGNISLPSNTVTAVVETRPPHVSFVKPEDDGWFDENLLIQLQSDDQDIAQVELFYRADSSADWLVLDTLSSEPYETTVATHEWNYGQYELKAVATDVNNNVDPEPSTRAARRRDSIAPYLEPPLTTQVEGGQVTIGWTPSPDSDVSGYEVYRKPASSNADYAKVEDVSGSQTNSFTDSIDNDGQYLYRVKAIDTWGNHSAAVDSDAVHVFSLKARWKRSVTGDSQEVLLIESPVPGTLTGSRVTDSGREEVIRVEIEEPDVEIAVMTDLLPGENHIVLSLADASGDLSRLKDTTVELVEAPAKVTGLNGTAQSYDVTLNWEPSSESNVIGYDVFRDGEKINQAIPVSYSSISYSRDSYRATYLANDDRDSSYWAPEHYTGTIGSYLEVEFNDAQVISEIVFDWYRSYYQATEITVLLEQNNNWTVYGTYQLDSSDLSRLTLDSPVITDGIRIRFDGLANDNWRAPLKIGELDFYAPDLVSVASYLDQDLSDAVYAYQVRAVNDRYVSGALSDPASVQVGDHVAPQPVVLEGTAQQADIQLTWQPSASTDVSRYFVYESGDRVGTVPAGNGTEELEFVQEGVQNGEYEYYVVAVDERALVSDPSNKVDLSVSIDVLPAPTLDSASVSDQNHVILEWTYEGAEPAQYYKVYRKAAENTTYAFLGNSIELSWEDDTVSLGQSYQYYVTAVDTNANESESSNTQQVDVLDTHAPRKPEFVSPTASGTASIQLYQPTVSLVGVAESGSTVRIYQDFDIEESVTALSHHVESEVQGRADNVFTASGPYVVVAERVGFSDYEYTVIDTRTMETVSEKTVSKRQQGDAVKPTQFGWVNMNTEGSITRFDVRSQEQISFHPETLSSSSIDFWRVSESGRILFIGANQGSDGRNLLWVDLESGDVSVIAEYNGYSVDADAISIAPNDKKVAYKNGNEILVYEHTSGAVTVVDTGDVANLATDLVWSADSERLVYEKAEGLYWYSLSKATVNSVEANVTPHGVVPGSRSGEAKTVLVLTRPFSFLPFTLKEVDIESGVTQPVSDLQIENVRELVSASKASILYTTTSSKLIENKFPGYFTLPNTSVDEGETVFTALSLDESDNFSGMSDALTVQFDGAEVSDLAATFQGAVSDVLVGSQRQAAIRVSNVGDSQSSQTEVTFTVLHESSTSPVSEQVQTVGALPSSGAETYFFSWTPEQEGTYHLLAEVTPSNSDEKNYSNNTGIRSVTAVADLGVRPGVVLEDATLSASDVLVGQASVTNSGEVRSGTWSVQVVDDSGYQVEELHHESGLTLKQGETAQLPIEWAASGTFAGQYRVVSQWQDGNGQLDTERVFDIAEDVSIDIGLSTNKAQYFPNEVVTIASTLERAQGNSVVKGAVAHVRVLDPESGVLKEYEHQLPDLLPQASVEMTYEWGVGNRYPGAYHIEAGVMHGEAVLAQSRLELDVLESSLELVGQLSVGNARMTSGSDMAYDYQVFNHSNFDLSELTLWLTGKAITNWSAVPVNLGAGSQIDDSGRVQLAEVSSGSYQVTLMATYDGVDYELDTQTIRVIDVTPPELSLVRPTEGQILNGERESGLVTASDGDSGLESVSALLDEERWSGLVVGDEGYEILLSGLEDGEHTVTAKATDHSGVEAQTSPVTFIADSTYPTIEVDGVSEGEFYGHSIKPEVTVADTHLKTSQVLLNGQLWNSERIEQEGGYSLSVVAEDAAENESRKVLAFTVDKTAPRIEITGAENDAAYNQDVDLKIDAQDEHLDSLHVELNGVVHSTESLTLTEDGDYELTVVAIDKALNQSSETLSFGIDQTPPDAPVVTSHADGDEVDSLEVDVVGSSEPRSVVNAHRQDDVVGSVLTDVDGAFSMPGVPLEEGMNQLVFTATDSLGNVSEPKSLSLEASTVALPEVEVSLETPGGVLVYLPLSEGTAWRRNNCNGQSDHCRDRLGNDLLAVNTPEAIELLESIGLSPSSYVLDSSTELFDTVKNLNDFSSEYQVELRFVGEQSALEAELRSQQYSQIWIVDLNARHGYPARFRHDLVHELAANVARGAGLAVLNTRGINRLLPSWSNLLGIRSQSGHAFNSDAVVMSENPVTEAGNYAYNGLVSQIRPQQGALTYGEIDCAEPGASGGNRPGRGRSNRGGGRGDNGNEPQCRNHTWPAMVLNKYGKGNVTLFAFNPAMLSKDERESVFDGLSTFGKNKQPVNYQYGVLALRSIVRPEEAVSVTLEHRSEGADLIGISGLGERTSDDTATWSIEEGYDQTFTSHHQLTTDDARFESVLWYENEAQFTDTTELTSVVAQDGLEEQLLEALGTLEYDNRWKQYFYAMVADAQRCTGLNESDIQQWQPGEPDELLSCVHQMARIVSVAHEMSAENMAVIDAAARLYSSYSAQWYALRGEHLGEAWPLNARYWSLGRGLGVVRHGHRWHHELPH